MSSSPSTTERGSTTSNPIGAAAGTDPTSEEIQRKPWKYVGYKGYADFIASDDDFFILRRFDSLGARVALSFQDEITVLEKELDELDGRHSKRESENLHNGTLRNDRAERKILLHTIAERLQRYTDLVLQQASLKKLPLAPRHNIKSIKNWHFNYDYVAIAAEEQTYLGKRDLVSVIHEEKTPLRRLIDSSLRLRTLPIWRHRKEELPYYGTGHVSYYSDERMDHFVSALIVAIGVTMLITPIWILQALETLTMKLGVITAFVLVFLFLLSFAMASRPFEALGATAAYTAVLMVFVQLGTTSK